MIQSQKIEISLYNQAKDAYNQALKYDPDNSNALDSISAIPNYMCGKSLLPSAITAKYERERDLCFYNCDAVFNACTNRCTLGDTSCSQRCLEEQKKCREPCIYLGVFYKD